ncbi:MAG: methyltransferase domain-containing protein [Acidobacteriota bacterium]|nr:methyltransferase domain-containing protein [Acidobacteriota bacterium]
MTDPRYYNNANPHLLAWMPAGLRLILEMGCGAGALGGTYLAEVNGTCRYLGVEAVAEQAEAARSKLSKVWTGNLEVMTNDAFEVEPGSLDCLIYGDVLEHLIDPWTELARRRPLLAPDGVVMACIPNVGHWSTLAQLFMGDWPYGDKGILDKTHLRFFTAKSIARMFEGAGYTITRMKGVLLDNKLTERFVPAFRETALRLGFDADAFVNQTSAYQYVVKAKAAATS